MKCRFCHDIMVSSGERIRDYGQPTQHVVAHMFICKSCHCQQSFDLDERLLDYDIFFPPYELNFDPAIPSFEIKYYPKPGSYVYEKLLKINQIPKNLTPKTVTVEKIKLLLVFS
jgi:hypothetical protein